ncbi:MAG TPA: peptidylprolyl isomerase [Candidatus Faecenecus gallistercoris]|jgi:peptidyl-prolyl cis-trans isomerase B (cyclophilin B)|uniref:Peptidyl-prolyl cis-trans isomerase n=1 Tax=Candidatus Faecenecus gallistercoris TaxID=2840793 RepID=A0A9D0YYU1_9FIRM|nr:peptidylprolyl isomerase [Candidatus Faecenecus gallistercoris]
MKKFRFLLGIVLIPLLFLTGCSSDEETLTGKHHAEIVVQDYGTIKVELDADQAPITVQNFIDLANSGFYDGLTFHRIIEGFMIQGGDPNGDGTGGSGHTIRGEFTQNGVNNTLSHTRGAISMARSSAMNSASSQFFIVHEDSTYLDGSYAVFGYVTEGMDVVDAIATSVTAEDSNGTVAKENQPVIEKITIID